MSVEQTGKHLENVLVMQMHYRIFPHFFPHSTVFGRTETTMTYLIELAPNLATFASIAFAVLMLGGGRI
jgi:hypothetical protein